MLDPNSTATDFKQALAPILTSRSAEVKVNGKAQSDEVRFRFLLHESQHGELVERAWSIEVAVECLGVWVHVES